MLVNGKKVDKKDFSHSVFDVVFLFMVMIVAVVFGICVAYQFPEWMIPFDRFQQKMSFGMDEVRWYALFWICGLHLIGYPVVLGIFFWKSFQFGFFLVPLIKQRDTMKLAMINDYSIEGVLLVLFLLAGICIHVNVFGNLRENSLIFSQSRYLSIGLFLTGLFYIVCDYAPILSR